MTFIGDNKLSWKVCTFKTATTQNYACEGPSVPYILDFDASLTIIAILQQLRCPVEKLMVGIQG